MLEGQSSPFRRIISGLESMDAPTDWNDEVTQLTRTIVAMREQIERDRAEQSSALQKAAAAHHDEIKQLQDAIRAQRAEIEQLHQDSRQKMQHMTVESAAEVDQLKDAIVARSAEAEEAARRHAAEFG